MYLAREKSSVGRKRKGLLYGPLPCHFVIEYLAYCLLCMLNWLILLLLLLLIYKIVSLNIKSLSVKQNYCS